MKAIEPHEGLSSALEDYLETIFELVRDNKLARVKDIAKARNVRSASVTPAMRRLAEMGLINYVQREYIDLTAEGDKQARRIYARHRVLTRFFHDILGVPRDVSLKDACAMEHSLSDITMDYIVRFFEFMEACPGGAEMIGRFHECSLVHGQQPSCDSACVKQQKAKGEREGVMTVKELKPGATARVSRIEGSGAIRQRLLDMGILPDVTIVMERVSPAGDPVWIRFQGTQLSLRGKEAASIMVTET